MPHRRHHKKKSLETFYGRNIKSLPEGSSIPRCSNKSYYNRQSTKDKLKDEIYSFLKKTTSMDVDQKIDYIFSKILELTKSQGGYLSLTDFDCDTSKLFGLRCQWIDYNSKVGQASDILDHNLPVGVYFPMHEHMLHCQAVNSNSLLFCNDKQFLTGHVCPGIKIANLVYLPLIYQDNIIALLCLCNRQNGYHLDLMEWIYPFTQLCIDSILKYRLRLGMEWHSEAISSKSLQPKVDDYIYQMVKRSNEISILVDQNWKILCLSDCTRKELLKILKKAPREADNLKDFLQQYPNGQPLLKSMETALAGHQISKMEHFQMEVATQYWNANYGPITKKEKNQQVIIGAFVFAKNMTELISIQKELEKAKNEAIQANKSKDLYLARMSHELRTPLNSIIGFAQLIESQEKTIQDYIHYILTGGQHLLRLINDILDITNIQAGKLTLSIEDMNLSECINNCLNLTGEMMKKKNLLLVNNLPNDLKIKADNHRVQQIILNIISNSIKYNKIDGEIKFDVSKNNGNNLEICISDTGLGIKEEHMNRLFTPFDRLGQKGDTIEGTGLGLVLSKNLVEQMGGRIRITSEYQVGTNVYLTFMKSSERHEDHGDIDNLKTSNNELNKVDKFIKKPTVLYIEDNPSNYKLMESILDRFFNVNLITASMGLRGFELAKNNQVDLVILDLGLPDIDGQDLIIKFKADKKLATIPIIVNSAFVSENMIHRVIELGAEAYVKKPFQIKELTDVLTKFVSLTSQLPNH